MYGRSNIDDDDDLYGGFDRIGSSTVYEEPTHYGNNMATRMGTSYGEDARPMTSIRGAGYRSNVAGQFDPLAQVKTTMTALKRKIENGPEFIAKELEREVNQLIVDSAIAKSKSSLVVALDRAKDAVKKERLLAKHCESNGLNEMINVDLQFAVQFNLADKYAANSMLTEALNIYNLIVKNKQFANAGRLRVNMGNIYFQQKKYSAAIKMYRMAMDLVGNTSKDTRFRIMRNIGNAFIRLGEYPDAIHAFESVMEGAPESQTGFNLIVCYFALGDKDKMKKGFLQLLSVPTESDSEHSLAEPSIPDPLSRYYTKRQAEHCRYVLCAAKLIAPVIEDDFDKGYQWLISSLRAPRPEASSSTLDPRRTGYDRLAMELDLCNGIAFLKRSDFEKATEVFRSVERQELDLHDRAACNLSFLYFLEGDYEQSKKYADMAIQDNRYNAHALVNRANIFFMERDYENATEMYLEAIGIEADCVQAVYNLALVYKQTGRLEDALAAFRKLHSLNPRNSEVVYEIADLYDQLNLVMEASEWFKILLGLVPNDGNALARLGRIASKLDDQTQAFHCFSEAYQCNPINMEVISWLGVWYVKSELYENAVTFFERAADIEPNEIKWKLMVATCYRRMGLIDKAFQLYQKIHSLEPESIECLKYLVSICSDLRQESLAEEFANKLARLTNRDAESMAKPKQPPVASMSTNPTKDVAATGPPIAESVPDGENVAESRTNTQKDDIHFDDVELDDELLPM